MGRIMVVWTTKINFRNDLTTPGSVVCYIWRDSPQDRNTMTDTEYNQGAIAFQSDLASGLETENPYPNLSSQERDWYAGYDDANRVSCGEMGI